MNRWAELPNEIQDSIMMFAQPTGQTHVCRLWSSLAQKYMYRCVYFETVAALVNFVRCQVNSNTGQLVQYLAINESIFDFLNRNAEETKTLMYTLFWRCPNVVRFSSGRPSNFHRLANEGKLKLRPIIYDMPLKEHCMESYIRCMSNFQHLHQFILSDTMSIGFIHRMIAVLERFSQLKVLYLVRSSFKEDIPKMIRKFFFLKSVEIKEIFLIKGKLMSLEGASAILNTSDLSHLERKPKSQSPVDEGGWDSTLRSCVLFGKNRYYLAQYNSHGENHQNDILQTFVYSYA
ncbi:hypothetical protein BY458DRAFT_521408 [Sporodiniella umbellata]|nr:hypothetical protein BY458DRAFT_521408 [Sporodiniella umbellata]